MTAPSAFNRLALIEAIYQGTSDVVCILAPDGAVLDANRSALAFAELPLTQALGMALSETPGFARHPALATWLREAVTGVGSGPTPEHRLIRSTPDGETSALRFTLTVVADDAGRSCLTLLAHDISFEEQTIGALRESKARFLTAAIQLIVDEETGALLDINPAAEAFYGWARPTMRSMLITDLDGRTLDAWRADASGKAMSGPSTGLMVNAHRIANGELREVEIAASPLNLAGRAARHLIVHDISDRLRAEEQLRESEATFRAVINGMSECVVVLDATGAIRAFNPEAEHTLGLRADELQGMKIVARDWKSVHENGAPWPPVEHPIMVALRTGCRQPRVLMGIRRGESEHVWLQVIADPLIREGEQTPYGAVAVFFDVTVQRNAEERLRQAQKLEAVGQLAGGIAHDFNNLLTVMRGAASFLRDSLATDAPQQEDVRAIERATERGEELTRRLLAVGRRQLLRPEPVDLNALLQDQFATIRDESPRTIHVELAPSPQRVIAQLDRRKLLDALRALVDNARSAMPEGGTLILGTDVRDVDRRSASTERGGARRFAMLEVRDNGAGMSDDVRRRLFEPFFSTQPFGANHGMGLASVHGMVAQSHGFMECDTALGEGTSLRLFFPLATEAERVLTPSSGMAAIVRRGVLLVDDDPMLRDLAGRMLERLGHSAAIVDSGADALALLASGAVQLSVLVTDLTMPGMGGIELITEVERRYPQLAIVAISGFSVNPAIRQVLAEKHVPFVEKPFAAEELEKAMNQALAEKAGQRA